MNGSKRKFKINSIYNSIERTKYLRKILLGKITFLTKRQRSYTKHYQTLLKEIKDLRQWKGSSCSQIGSLWLR